MPLVHILTAPAGNYSDVRASSTQESRQDIADEAVGMHDMWLKARNEALQP